MTQTTLSLFCMDVQNQQTIPEVTTRYISLDSLGDAMCAWLARRMGVVQGCIQQRTTPVYNAKHTHARTSGMASHPIGKGPYKWNIRIPIHLYMCTQYRTECTPYTQTYTESRGGFSGWYTPQLRQPICHRLARGARPSVRGARGGGVSGKAARAPVATS